MSVLSFLIFFAIYAGAAFPSFGSDGQAELLAAAATNGVPPPPAQTLAWLAAKILFWFPLGSPAYRLNLLGAALMAATVPLMAGALTYLSPPKGWAASPAQELERERWRATARWLTAFLWGLSPGPWRCALSFGPETVGLFLTFAAFRAAAAGDRVEWFSPAAFAAGLAVGQWPLAALALPGWFLMAFSKKHALPAPPFSAPWFRRAGTRTFSFTAGLAPALGTMILSRGAPPLDFGSPDGWASWARHALTLPPFLPPARIATLGAAGASVLRSLGSAYTIPGALLWLYGLARLSRSRLLISQAALITALLAGPVLFLAARPVGDPSSGPQAAAWGLCALGLAVPFLWGLHRAGVKAPAARAALVLLLPLSLAARLPSAARNDVALETRAKDLLAVLSPGALLWDSVSPGALFYARYVEGIRPDIRVARRPDQDWARAEYRRRHPESSPMSPYLLSPDLFFFDVARETGPDNVFADSPNRLPAVDPATGLAVNGRFPEDALPSGPGFQYFPSDSRRLVDPSAQIPLMGLPLWGARAEDPEGTALARLALSRKFDQYGLAPLAEEEAWAALADDPGLPDAHRRLGEAALDRGDGARAAIHFRRALRRVESQADLWALAARAEWSVGDRVRAAAHARRALDLDPSLEDTRRALAEALDRDGRFGEAADEWRLLMNRRPEERLYVWSLAKSEKAAGRPEKARAALREYLLFPLSSEDRDEAEAFEKSLGKSR